MIRSLRRLAALISRDRIRVLPGLLAAAVQISVGPAFAMPAVMFSDPLDQTVGVPLNHSIEIHFANRLSAATISSNTVFVTSHLRGTLPAAVTWNGGTRVITIIPDESFLPGERIVATVTKNVTDPLGIPLPNGYRTEFSTWSAPMPDAEFVATTGADWNTGSVALNLTVADLDGDRLPEAIFSNVVPDSLTILRPDGLGGFAFWRRVPTPILPRHTVAADVDGDGLLDLVSCGSGPNQIAVFRNAGGGNLAPYETYPTGQTPYGAFAGDLDADGDLDIATANFNGHDVSVLRNQGDGTFEAPVSHSVLPADSPRWVDGADLDRDGDVDLVCCNGYSSDVSVLLNDGTGALTVQPVRIAVEDSPNFLEVRDFDGDGDSDVVTVNAGPGSISFLGGNGDGTFQPAVHFAVSGTLPYGIQVADFDGDFDLDVGIPIRGSTPNSWQIMWNDGSGAFTAGELHPGGTHCHTIGAADWDFDGDLDVAAGFAITQDMYLYSQAPVPSVVATEPTANASGAPIGDPLRLWFSTPLDPESLTSAGFVVRGDRSGPATVELGWSDLTNLLTITPAAPFLPGEIVTVTLAGGGLVSSAEGVAHPGFAFEFMTEGAASSGAFGAISIPLPGTDPIDLASADLDDDAVSDIVVANFLSNDVAVLLTGGDGLPEVAATVPVGSGPVAVCAGDLTGDGEVDVAVANLISHSISILTNAGGGTLLAGSPVPTSGGPFSVEAGDFDLDGDLDLVVAEVSPNGVRVYWNDGTGAFPSVEDIGAGGLPLDAGVADVDRDGDLDVVSVDSENHRLEILLWDPAVGFVPGGAYPTGDSPVQVLPWDTDGDGWIDLVNTDYGSNTLSILENAGDGTFLLPATALGTNRLPRGLWGSDLTGDGSLDLAVANSGTTVLTLFRNLGGGLWDTGTNIAVGVTPYAVTGGDWNGDGRVDVATVNRTTGDLTILVNSATTGVEPVLGAPLLATGLVGAHPNPFRDEASIELDLGRSLPVVLRVFDLRGRAVATIHDGVLPPGSHRIRWDGRDRSGLRVATGVYFVRMDAGEGSWTRKLLRIR